MVIDNVTKRVSKEFGVKAVVHHEAKIVEVFSSSDEVLQPFSDAIKEVDIFGTLKEWRVFSHQSLLMWFAWDVMISEFIDLPYIKAVWGDDLTPEQLLAVQAIDPSVGFTPFQIAARYGVSCCYEDDFPVIGMQAGQVYHNKADEESIAFYNVLVALYPEIEETKPLSSIRLDDLGEPAPFGGFIPNPEREELRKKAWLLTERENLQELKTAKAKGENLQKLRASQLARGLWTTSKEGAKTAEAKTVEVRSLIDNLLGGVSGE